jgi:hypothetical protein
MLAPSYLKGLNLSHQMEILQRATEAVQEMLRELRKGGHLERVKSKNDELQTLEGEADDLLLELLRGLYASQHDTVRVVFLKDFYELLEKVADRCRDAGNVINHIVLKNS